MPKLGCSALEINYHFNMSPNPLKLFLFGTLLLIAGGCRKDEPTPPALPETAIIVYMAADNNLEDYAKNNINQMEQAVTRENQTLLVYLNASGEAPRVLKIVPDSGPEIVSPAVLTYSSQNAADPQVMKQVLEDIRQAYPAASYGLILWSHATSWMPPGSRPTTLAFGDDQGEQMDIRELKNALPGTYDYIVFDACSMASVEVVYELRTKTDYILASPTETIASGMPYHRVIPHFFEGHPGLQKVADKYVEYYQEQDGLYRSATMSLIDTREMTALAAATKAVLEQAEFSDPDYHRSEVQRLDFDSPPATEGYDFLDFFVKNLPSEHFSAVRQQLEKTVLFKLHTSEFIGQPIEAFCGLSCYIPHPGDELINNYYRNLEWTQASGFHLLIR